MPFIPVVCLCHVIFTCLFTCLSLPLNYEFYEVRNELYLYYTHPPFRGNEEKGKETCRQSQKEITTGIHGEALEKLKRSRLQETMDMAREVFHDCAIQNSSQHCITIFISFPVFIPIYNGCVYSFTGLHASYLRVIL